MQALGDGLYYEDLGDMVDVLMLRSDEGDIHVLADRFHTIYVSLVHQTQPGATCRVLLDISALRVTAYLLQRLADACHDDLEATPRRLAVVTGRDIITRTMRNFGDSLMAHHPATLQVAAFNCRADALEWLVQEAVFPQ